MEVRSRQWPSLLRPGVSGFQNLEANYNFQKHQHDSLYIPYNHMPNLMPNRRQVMQYPRERRPVSTIYKNFYKRPRQGQRFNIVNQFSEKKMWRNLTFFAKSKTTSKTKRLESKKKKQKINGKEDIKLTIKNAFKVAKNYQQNSCFTRDYKRVKMGEIQP